MALAGATGAFDISTAAVFAERFSNLTTAPPPRYSSDTRYVPGAIMVWAVRNAKGTSAFADAPQTRLVDAISAAAAIVILLARVFIVAPSSGSASASRSRLP
jgi:hypothetical protein